MLRKMSLTDVLSLTQIHLSSWDENEMSVKLGSDYVRLFYHHVVISPHSFGYVYLDGEQIAGYATGFYDYGIFNRTFRNQHLFQILFILTKGLIAGKITLLDMLAIIIDDKKLRKAKHPKYHLGALGLANPYKRTRFGKTAITQTMVAVLDELKNRRYSGCWGICDFKNTPMRKYLLKLGFSEVDIVKIVNRSVVLYEIKFS